MASHAAELACIVLSFRGQPSVVAAVRSLLDQGDPIELVVVNSGGGDPTGLLRAAGLDVRVISVEQRLFAGGARNLGIGATTAPYVAFLAADCTAETGWVRGRLTRHQAGALAVSSAVTNANASSVIGWTAHVLVHARRMPGISPAQRTDHGLSYARTLFDQYGLFRADMRVSEDTEFNQRLKPSVPIEWAPDVRSAHLTPTSLRALLRDQFVRGQRRVHAEVQLGRRSPQGYLLLRSLNILRQWQWAWLATRGRDRAYVLATICLIPWAWLARCAGIVLSGRPAQDRADRPRVLALLQFHNEMRYLPGYFQNVPAQVDGIIALDDGSTDGSGDFVAQQPSVLGLIRLPASEPHVWNEPENRRRLIEAALQHTPDWLIAVDADERLERDFRERAVREIWRAEARGYGVYYVRLRELWDHPDTYRVDGLWGRKRRNRLFKARPDHSYDMRALHGSWAPLNGKRRFRLKHRADLIIYHLKMIHRQDRIERQQRYQTLDPDRQWQARGYDYLTEETGLRLEKCPLGRDYFPLDDAPMVAVPEPSVSEETP